MTLEQMCKHAEHTQAKLFALIDKLTVKEQEDMIRELEKK